MLSTIFLRLNFGLVCLVLFGLQMFCCKCCGRSRDLVVVGFTTTYAISAYLVITTNIVSSNPADGEVYSTQYYAIKFVSDLRQVGGFLQFPPPINWQPWYNWNIVESGVKHHNPNPLGRRGHDSMLVGFTTTYVISAYHHRCCEFESRSGRSTKHYVIKFVSDL